MEWKRENKRERKKKEERGKKMARASRFMIRYKISLIALHGLLIKPPLLDDESSMPLASCFNSVTKAAMDESTLVLLGLLCALRWVEVFESNCMTQNGSEDSLRILGLILEEFDEGLFVLLASIKFGRTREKSNFLDLRSLQWRSRTEDRFCAKSARGSAEVPRVVNLQHCSVEPLERW
jgi:hypothetical protein